MNRLPLFSPGSTLLPRTAPRRRTSALALFGLLVTAAALPGSASCLAQAASTTIPAPQTPAGQVPGGNPASTPEASTTTPADSGTARPPAPALAQDPAPPAPGAPASSTTPVVDATKYVIGPEDNLQITVWREPSLSGVLPVRPDGMISLVLIGDLKAAGYTPMQLGADITQRLRKYIQDPSVTVAVTAVLSKRVFLVGEIGKVGPIPLTPDMTPLQAISSAGGPTPYANVKHIYILRGTGASQQKIPFNYKQALKGEVRPGLILQPGDTIVIP